MRAMLILIIGLSFAGPAGPAAADSLQQFHDRAGAAMKHVRLAQFYLRTGNLAVAGAELDEATEKWAAVTGAFAAKPPGKLAEDRGFRADIEAVAGALAAALDAVDRDEREAATAQLKPVAGRLAALRIAGSRRTLPMPPRLRNWTSVSPRWRTGTSAASGRSGRANAPIPRSNGCSPAAWKASSA